MTAAFIAECLGKMCFPVPGGPMNARLRFEKTVASVVRFSACQQVHYSLQKSQNYRKSEEPFRQAAQTQQCFKTPLPLPAKNIGENSINCLQFFLSVIMVNGQTGQLIHGNTGFNAARLAAMSL